MSNSGESRDWRGNEKLETTATTIEAFSPGVELRDMLSFRQILFESPAVVWWAFYWGMAGGFSVQFNGAILSIPYMQDGEAIVPARWQTAFHTVPFAAAFFSTFLCAWGSDRIGRKWGMLIGLLLVTGGVPGEMFVLSPAGFVGVKILLGCGQGFTLTLAPMTPSEIAPVALRGLATSGVNLGTAIGQLPSSAVIKGFGTRSDNRAFRAPFATQLLFVVFLLADRREDAAQSLRRLYGSKADIEAEVAAIDRAVALEHESSSHGASWLQCFRGTDLRRTMISMSVFICRHFVGIIFVLGYSPYFFQLAGLPDSKSFNLGIGVTACGVAGNVLSWFLVNSLGRRTVFLTGMVSLLVILLLIGIMDVVPSSRAQWVQAAVMVIYNFVWFATIGSMAYAILGEVSNATLRARTAGLAAATQAVMSVVMHFACPYMINPDQGNLQGKVGVVFGGLTALTTLWSFLYVRELKGRSVDEIDRMFYRGVNPSRMGSVRL
ncbi:putative MFS alpha-glucoside transporter [Aspergillus stella-maris]|uniref:putative MFS alpha-glucoside transporter n=1 Tax=Aspergillus stella-maris TaxID=1810926 RepID=UPI003CCD454A